MREGTERRGKEWENNRKHPGSSEKGARRRLEEGEGGGRGGWEETGERQNGAGWLTGWVGGRQRGGRGGRGGTGRMWKG